MTETKLIEMELTETEIQQIQKVALDSVFSTYDATNEIENVFDETKILYNLYDDIKHNNEYLYTIKRSFEFLKLNWTPEDDLSDDIQFEISKQYLDISKKLESQLKKKTKKKINRNIRKIGLIKSIKDFNLCASIIDRFIKLHSKDDSNNFNKIPNLTIGLLLFIIKSWIELNNITNFNQIIPTNNLTKFNQIMTKFRDASCRSRRGNNRKDKTKDDTGIRSMENLWIFVKSLLLFMGLKDETYDPINKINLVNPILKDTFFDILGIELFNGSTKDCLTPQFTPTLQEVICNLRKIDIGHIDPKKKNSSHTPNFHARDNVKFQTIVSNRFIQKCNSLAFARKEINDALKDKKLEDIKTEEELLDLLGRNRYIRQNNYFDDLSKKWGLNLIHSRNGGEYQLTISKNKTYYYDAVDITKRIIVEFNEPSHYKNGKLKEKDLKKIEETLKKLNFQSEFFDEPKWEFYVYNERESKLYRYDESTKELIEHV